MIEWLRGKQVAEQIVLVRKLRAGLCERRLQSR
jgi:hypothetical protein